MTAAISAIAENVPSSKIRCKNVLLMLTFSSTLVVQVDTQACTGQTSLNAEIEFEHTQVGLLIHSCVMIRWLL